MNSKMKIIGIYLIVILVSFVMASLQINFFIVLTTILLIVFFGLTFPQLKMAFWETDLNKIEKFLINNKKNPNYQLFYALANNLDEEVEDAIEKLLSKYKNKHKQALFKVIYAFYKKEIVTAKQEIEYIKPANYMRYYKSTLLLEEGNLNEAKQLIEEISIPWMKYALLSELENKLNNPEEAIRLAKMALDQVKGLQKYILYKTYQREFPNMKM